MKGLTNVEDAIVSVVCLTYNHGKYIEQTIQSVLCQKTDFIFELIIHDDHSVDNTVEIIRRYEAEYPNVVRTICEEENQHSKGVDVFYESTMPHIRSKYIAFCEGDDFWTDPYKLQMQYDAMENNPQIDMCACTASEVYGSDEKLIQLIRPIEKDGILSIEDVILGGGRYLATVSLFCRSGLFRAKRDFEKIISFDYTYQIKGALRGGIYYIDRNMATYRNCVPGSWTSRIERDSERRKRHVDREIKMLECLDYETDGQFHEILSARISSYRSFFDQLMDQKDIVLERIKALKGPLYLWGMGMRGDAFMEFCHVNDFPLIGVCDIKDEHIGEYSDWGYPILSCSDVVENASDIVASNTSVKKYLEGILFQGSIIDLQDFLIFT